MAKSKEQGRLARMGAFWMLFLLAGYGCLSGLPRTLSGWMGGTGEEGADSTLIGQFPLFGELRVSTLIAIGVLAVIGFMLHRWISSPKISKALSETETELRKVTWPSGEDTTNGAVAVIITVVVLLGYLILVDGLLVSGMRALLSGGA